MSDRERLIGELRHIENVLPSSGIGMAAYQAAAMLRADADLLAALEAGEALIAGDLTGLDWKTGCAGFLIMARAAIAKAKGEGK